MAAGISPQGAMPQGRGRSVYTDGAGHKLANSSDAAKGLRDLGNQIDDTVIGTGLADLSREQSGSNGTAVVSDNSKSTIA